MLKAVFSNNLCFATSTISAFTLGAGGSASNCFRSVTTRTRCHGDSASVVLDLRYVIISELKKARQPENAVAAVS